MPENGEVGADEEALVDLELRLNAVESVLVGLAAAVLGSFPDGKARFGAIVEETRAENARWRREMVERSKRQLRHIPGEEVEAAVGARVDRMNAALDRLLSFVERALPGPAAPFDPLRATPEEE